MTQTGLSEDAGHGTDTAIAVIYTLYDDLQVAEHVVADVVQSGLAACANILSPGRSCYLWNGNYETQTKIPVLFKTSMGQRRALMARLAETHPYDVPAILSWDAGAAPPYAAWVGTMTGGGAPG
ncbi:MAG TPA: divalent-cation tolerance protein CutA [Sphingobium sp.]